MKCLYELFELVIFLGIWRNTLGADTPPTSCVEKQMLDLFTKWRQGETLPVSLPPIEVINIQSIAGQYSGFGIKISYETGKMKLAGVNNFTVTELVASVTDTLEASGSIQFPILTLTADNYNLKGRAYVFYTLKGSGAMHVAFENVKLMFGITLGPRGGGTEVKYIWLNFGVDHVKIDLAGSSWPINKVLNAEAISIIDSYHSALVDMATAGVKYTLSNYLATTTPAQLASTFVGDCIDNK